MDFKRNPKVSVSGNFGFSLGKDILEPDVFKLIFDEIKDILTLDCNVVLNSCYLGQTQFESSVAHLESTAVTISKIIPDNVVIASISDIEARSFIQELYVDEITNILVIFCNIPIDTSKEDINRMYAYCQTAENPSFSNRLLRLFEKILNDALKPGANAIEVMQAFPRL